MHEWDNCVKVPWAFVDMCITEKLKLSPRIKNLFPFSMILYQFRGPESIECNENSNIQEAPRVSDWKLVV